MKKMDSFHAVNILWKVITLFSTSKKLKDGAIPSIFSFPSHLQNNSIKKESRHQQGYTYRQIIRVTSEEKKAGHQQGYTYRQIRRLRQKKRKQTSTRIYVSPNKKVTSKEKKADINKDIHIAK